MNEKPPASHRGDGARPRWRVDVRVALFATAVFAFTVSAEAGSRDRAAGAADASGGPRANPAMSRPPFVREWARSVEEGLGLTKEQRRRVQMGLMHEGFDPGPEDGVFGPRTRGAIGGWQDARGEDATGYLSKEQAEALLHVAYVVTSMANAALAADGTRGGDPGATRGKRLVLSACEWARSVEEGLELTKEQRRRVQMGLMHEGFDPGPEDGVFGPRTRGAIGRMRGARMRRDTWTRSRRRRCSEPGVGEQPKRAAPGAAKEAMSSRWTCRPRGTVPRWRRTAPEAPPSPRPLPSRSPANERWRKGWGSPRSNGGGSRWG